MSKTRIYYTEYKGYPKATEFSLKFNSFLRVIELFAGFGVIACFCVKWYYGLLGIAGFYLLMWLLSKWEKFETETIILQEQKEQAERAEYNDLMNRQTKWRDNNELLALGKNSETIKSIAKEKGLTAEQYYYILQMENENYVLIHKRYNETHEKKIPFPKI